MSSEMEDCHCNSSTIDVFVDVLVLILIWGNPYGLKKKIRSASSAVTTVCIVTMWADGGLVLC